MAKMVKEFNVAPDEQQLREALPEMDCISQALLNQWILDGKCRPLQTIEFVLPAGIRYFRVWAEIEDSSPAELY